MNDRANARSGSPPIHERLRDVRAQIARRVIGLTREIDLLICAILADRHVLVEGVPGVGKTHLVNTLAGVMGCACKRIQFTPDLLPADILGSHVFDPRDRTFSLRRGPVFANIILADEINRAPAKTQSALLEVMQERQVTIEGDTIAVERPFFVFATQNPLEHEGVYPLPQAQLDRFAMRLLPGYLSPEDELCVLQAHRSQLPVAQRVLDGPVIIDLQRAVESVTISDEIFDLIIRLCRHTRQHETVMLGASPRMALDLMQLARAHALLDRRQHVIPDDLKSLIHSVGNHRIVLTPQGEIAGHTVEQVIDEALQSTRLV